MRYRRDIEGMRALAVSAVLLYHFGVPGIGGGFVGVDIFFVISGFLITSLLVDERLRTGGVSIKGFYARRARRLLPISTTVVVATAIAGFIWLPITRLDDLAEELRAAALFAANLLFADRGTDYLTASLVSPLQHYWSLAVEEQFYLLWPGLIALITLRARNVLRRTAWAMGLIIVASFAASALLTESSPSWSFFGLHTRAWELGVGALLACITSTTDRIPPRIRAVIGWLGIAGIVGSAVWMGEVSVFPGYAAALPVLATGAVLIAGNRTPGSPSTLLLRREPMHYLGTRSYSLYLWHWPVLIIAEGHLLRSLTFVEKLFALAATFALAEVGFRVVEQPVRQSRSLARRPGKSLAIGAMLIVAAVTTSSALAAYDPDLSTGVVAAAPTIPATTTSTTTAALTDVTTTTALPQAPPPIAMSGTPALQAVVDAMAQTVIPDNLRPKLSIASNDASQLYRDGCHQFQANHIRTDCVYGDPNGGITIALWGDSHAAQWFSPLNTIAISRGWRLLSLTQGSCAFIDVVTFDHSTSTGFRNCAGWRDEVRQYMREQGVDVVFVSQHYGLFAAKTERPIDVGHWEDNLPSLIESLRSDGIEPIVIGDSPDPPANVPDCVASHRRSLNACAATMYDAGDIPVVEAIRAITLVTGVGFIEPGEWVCTDDNQCPVVIGDILVYRDAHHLSDTIAQWLTPVVENLVGPFVDDLVHYRSLSG
ncbi:MAG: acyltransferase family protein [Ilumatobacteraceae bacterium]